LKKFKLEKAFHECGVSKLKPFNGAGVDFYYEPFEQVEQNMRREDMMKKLTSPQQNFVKSLMGGVSIKELGLDKDKLGFMVKQIQNELHTTE